jgi:hypothetical protein
MPMNDREPRITRVERRSDLIPNRIVGGDLRFAARFVALAPSL